MKIGLYLHLPFCKKKCPYCDFFSVTQIPDEKLYLQALSREIDLLSDFLNKTFSLNTITIDTFYAGGGTPSLFSPSFFERLFERLSKTFDFKPLELTIEVNPESFNSEKAKGYKMAGFNRVSLGVQTFQKGGLNFLRRIHTPKESFLAIESALKAGFENISLDFIYAWKGEGLKTLKKDLDLALSFEVTHLSFYELTLYPETPFFKEYRKDAYFSNEKRVLMLFSFIRDYLQANGFQQYEISNYARPGFECRHNLKYWKLEPYLGIGAGAVSRIGNLRFENIKNLEKYYDKLLKDRSLPNRIIEKLDNFELAKEYLFMGLRLVEGIEMSRLKELGYMLKKEALLMLKKGGLIRLFLDRLSLTEKGMSLHNQVVKFLWNNLERLV